MQRTSSQTRADEEWQPIIIGSTQNMLTYPWLSHLIGISRSDNLENDGNSLDEQVAVRQRNKAISVMLRANFDGVTLRFAETPRPSALPSGECTRECT